MAEHILVLEEAEAATILRGPQANRLGPLGAEDPSTASGRDRNFNSPGPGPRTQPLSGRV